MLGLKPYELYGLELWEYNAVLAAHTEKQKTDVYNAILTGYYTAYYMNGGKNVKTPHELMQKAFETKQSAAEGFAQIERIKKLEQKGGI